MQRRILCSVLTIVTSASVAAAAPRPLAPPAREAFRADAAGDFHAATFFLGTGFEVGEGFTTGPLEPQNGWDATGTNLPWASISTAAPFSGQQHLRLIEDPASPVGALRIAFSPVLAPLPPTSSTVYVKVKISNDQGADYDVFGQAPSQNLVAWRVEFSFSDDSFTGPGTIYVLDNPGTGLRFVSTNVRWTPGVYKELRVDLDNAAHVIRYYYDGALIYTGSIFGATTVEQVGVLHDHYQLPGETCDVDALSLQGLGEPAVSVRSMTWGEVKSLMR